MTSLTVETPTNDSTSGVTRESVIWRQGLTTGSVPSASYMVSTDTRNNITNMVNTDSSNNTTHMLTIDSRNGDSIRSDITINAVTSNIFSNVTELSVTPATEAMYTVPWVTVAVFVILILLLVTSNGLVMIAVSKYRFLQTKTNILVCALAAVDMSVTVTMTTKTINLVQPAILGGRFWPCMVVSILSMGNCLNSCSILLAIAVERYLGTFHVLFHKIWITPNVVKVVVTCITLYNISLLIAFTATTQQWHEENCFYFTVYPFTSILVFNVHAIMIVIFIFLIYIKIFLKVLGRKKKIGIQGMDNPAATVESQTFKENLRLIVKFAVVIGVFATCCLPFLIITLIMSSDLERYATSAPIWSIYDATVILFGLNSIMNPIIYALKFGKFRKAFKLLFSSRTSES